MVSEARELRELGEAGPLADVLARVREGRDGPVVVIVGRGNLASSANSVVSAAAALAGPGTLFLSALRRANVHGALDAGLAPGFLPGRVTFDAGRDWYNEQWGGVPKARGLDTEGILRAAADGQIDVLILLGADPVSDFPDATLAQNSANASPSAVVGSSRRHPVRASAASSDPSAAPAPSSRSTSRSNSFSSLRRCSPMIGSLMLWLSQ